MMKRAQFESLARSRIVRSYEESFQAATGFVLKLQPADGGGDLNPFGTHVNPFCSLMACCPQARQVCQNTFAAIRDKAAKTRAPGKSRCFAGITHVSYPVISAGEHIATIYGGQFVLEKPTARAFQGIACKLVRLGLGDRLPELEKAWFRTPVVTDKQFRSILYLLESFAARISRLAAAGVLEPVDGEPPLVTKARKFIQDRFAEPISMPDVARHLHMSASGFSRMFRQAVGIPFTSYLARVRVEKSKGMLARPALTIRSIAFQSGFDSISQFNRSFRQYTGMAPTRYRLSLAECDPAA